MTKTINVLNENGSATKKTVELDQSVFGATAKDMGLLKIAYLSKASKMRNAHPKTKDRGEVRGGGRKPWRQKGTGRARHGSIRSPIWRGGGVVFGPTAEKKYIKILPRKARKLAIRQALSLAIDNDQISLIEKLPIKEPDTATMFRLLKTVANGSKRHLVIVKQYTDTLGLSLRNLVNVKACDPLGINVYDIMNADHILIEAGALPAISAHLLADRKAENG